MLRWYVVHTHPKQEDRVADNLRSYSIETFIPRFECRRYNPYSDKPTFSIKPLFPNYIFARFKSAESLHKIRFTRGIHTVVSACGIPCPIDDEQIELIKSRQGVDGVIKLDEDLKSGDEVMVKSGPLQGLQGVFERRLKGADRVLILLGTVTYQHQIMIDRQDLARIPESG
jgi:transcriptional antiterminator RfaH